MSVRIEGQAPETADQNGDNRALLQELLWSYGPCGQEKAVRDICLRELAPVVDDVWVDSAGNLVGRVAGAGNQPGREVRVMAHMDELSMLVKRIHSDGTLQLTHLGTMYPGNFGLGPVTMLGREAEVCGVMTVGSEHTTKESPRIWETKPDGGDKSLDWSHVYVFTGRTPDELKAAGVRPGTRVCIHRSKRNLVEVGDYLGSYFMDDRALVLALLTAARRLQQSGRRPCSDVYFVFTTNEEVGGVGGSYAARVLPGDLTLALEVGPAEAEYGTSVASGPMVVYSDGLGVYDKTIADRLMQIATEQGADPQPAVLGTFESDASHAKASGLSALAALLCLPTLSTHGYEVVHKDGIDILARLVAEFLLRPA
jgi:putative aminopeptidase FrvX